MAAKTTTSTGEIHQRAKRAQESLSLKIWFNEKRAKRAQRPKRRKGFKYWFLAAALGIGGTAAVSRGVDMVRHTPPNGTVISADLATRIVTQEERAPSYEVGELPSRETAKDGYRLPAYAALPPAWQALLERSAASAGFTGPDIYGALTDKQKACLLNLLARSQSMELQDGSTVLDHLQELREIRQDRIFVTVDANMAALMDAESKAPDGGFYKRSGIGSMLHGGPGAFDKHASYKTRDARGTFDVTLSRSGGEWLAEMDIDYYRGLRHFFFEVAYNHIFDTHTDPARVEKILRKHHGIDPGFNP